VSRFKRPDWPNPLFEHVSDEFLDVQNNYEPEEIESLSEFWGLVRQETVETRTNINIATAMSYWLS
jgi:hypothetical protein